MEQSKGSFIALCGTINIVEIIGQLNTATTARLTTASTSTPLQHSMLINYMVVQFLDEKEDPGNIST
jgi:hypothetical protein